MMTWGRTPVGLGFCSSTTTTGHRCPSVISAQLRRRFHPPQSSSSSSQRRSTQEDIGGVGHAVLNALQSSSQSAPNLSNSETLAFPAAANPSNRDRKQSKKEHHQSQKQQRTLKEERELSGSEVLLALQKARARKGQTLKPTTKKKKVALPVPGGGRGGGETDCRNVRPLNVKSDWGVRLEELERQLQEFLNT